MSSSEALRNQNYRMLTRTRKCITSTLVVAAAIIVLARGDTHAAPTVVIVVAITVALLYGYAVQGQQSLYTSLLPAALALEGIIQLLIQRRLTAQIIVTAGVSALLLLSNNKTRIDDSKHLWWMPWRHWDRILHVKNRNNVYLWIAARAIIIVVSNTTAETRIWFTAQVLLLLCILAYASKANPLRNAAAVANIEAIAAKLSGNYEAARKADNVRNRLWLYDSTRGIRLLIIAIFGVVASMYTGSNVVPWGINIAVLTIPVYYVLNSSVPSPHPGSSADSRATLALAIYCIGITLAWDHTVPTVVTGPTHSLACPRFSNMQVCGANPPVLSIVNNADHCCCMTEGTAGSYYIPLRSKAGCVPRHCRARIKPFQTTEWDCCGNQLTPQNQKLIGGKYQCVCGNTPSNPNLHQLTADGTKCACAANYTGTYCGCEKGYTGPYCTVLTT